MRREKLFSILVLGFLILICKKIIMYKQQHEFEFESECVCKQDKKILLTIFKDYYKVDQLVNKKMISLGPKETLDSSALSILHFLPT